MDAIFQQAPFDEKNDIKRIEEIAKDVEQRAKRTSGYCYHECSRCGHNRPGFANIVDGSFVCIQCLIKDKIEREFKEPKCQ